MCIITRSICSSVQHHLQYSVQHHLQYSVHRLHVVQHHVQHCARRLIDSAALERLGCIPRFGSENGDSKPVFALRLHAA